MSPARSGSPAGIPSRMATRAGPCDSPAVRKRSTIEVPFPAVDRMDRGEGRLSLTGRRTVNGRRSRGQERRLIPFAYLCKVSDSPGAAGVEILTSQQMRNVDRRASSRFGLPEIVLMENAGLRLFQILQDIEPDLTSRSLLLLCGRGNNGGDTFVLARHLHNHGIPFAALLFGRRDEVRGSAAVNLRALARVGVVPPEVRASADWKTSWKGLASSDLIVDGILGTGLSRPVTGLLARVFEDVNASPAEVVAVDIPSGLSGY